VGTLRGKKERRKPDTFQSCALYPFIGFHSNLFGIAIYLRGMFMKRVLVRPTTLRSKHVFSAETAIFTQMLVHCVHQSLREIFIAKLTRRGSVLTHCNGHPAQGTSE